jgi:Cu+-exporting ATPase
MNSTRNYKLVVDGMMCEKNCASTVKKSLESTFGVKRVDIHFSTKIADVHVEKESKITIQDLIEVVEAVGFDAKALYDNPLETLPDKTSFHFSSAEKYHFAFKVKGLISITSCPGIIKSKLLSIPHVRKVEVDFDNNIIYVWGNAKQADIRNSLISDGYFLTLMENFLIDNESTEHSFNDENLCHLELNIQGMTCANCVKSVENALKSVDGVYSVKVALLAEKAEIEYDSSITQHEKIMKQVKDIGYTVNFLTSRSTKDNIKKEYMYSLSGLLSFNCKSKIESAIRSLPLVEDAQVSLRKNRLLVIVRAPSSCSDTQSSSFQTTGPRDILDKVTSLDYGCKLIPTGGAIGLNLEGRIPDGNNKIDRHSELRLWGGLLIIASFFGLPILFLNFLMPYIEPLRYVMGKPSWIFPVALTTHQTLMITLNSPIQFFVGYKFYRSAAISAIHGTFGMDFLIALGTTVTFLYSFVSVIFAIIYGIRAQHLFFEASGMLLLFVTFGKFLEAYAKGQTVSAMSTLLKLQPQEVCLSSFKDEFKSLIS